ncbi:CARDB domain-containing protein [Sorangium sp. So ce1097]|uniref:CARDB domain-containing protein n=1 Tax=Sorangium sp. So ce1097 TaxID=3133330 RepID=UPI003F61AB23
MVAITAGCGSGGAPGEPEPLGVATEALTGDEPDLVISSVSGPPSALPGGYFTTIVTVCNQGNSASYSTRVEVSLSDDDVFTPSDPITGFAVLTYLAPGQCAELGVETAAAVPDGTYTLGAVVDAFEEEIELSETNNAAAGSDIGIGYGPDLVVSAVSGPPSAPPGGGFAVQVTVCNQGTTSAPTPLVDVLLSPDATIEPSDQLLFGGAPVPWLNPGACEPVTVPVSAHVAEGVYHLGAIAHENGWDEELITSNNARAGGLLGVGHAPDLVVSAVSGPPSVFPGSWFDASVTVCNQGTQPSDGAELDVFFSSDGQITPADFPIVSDGHVPSLSPGECFSATIDAYAYVPDGTYTLGAIVDPTDWALELIETNNASAGGVIGIGHGPDLVVSSVGGPPSTAPYGMFDASVTVCNQGTQPAYGTQVELRLSSDAIVTAADVPAGGGPVPHLEPGQCTAVSFPAYPDFPSYPAVTEGAYHLGAIVDPYGSVPELLEGNNTAAGAVIGVGYRPDLIVSTVSAPPSALPGSGFEATVTVCNQGTTPSYGTTLELRLSPDDTITWADAPAGGAQAPYLDPGQCAAVTLPASADVPEGAYHLGAIVDPYGWQEELIETNNASAGALLGVGHRPDLVVSAVSGPPTLVPGSGFSASVTVCNQGTTPSHGGGVDVVLSADRAITPFDVPAGSGHVPDLSPGQCASVAVPASAYVPDGVYHLGAIVDPAGSLVELIETNNASAGRAIGVGHAPDLVVSAVSGPPSVLPGEPFDASVTVCNQGTQTSYGTNVELFLSADATLTTADSPAGGGPVPDLDPGQCATVTFPTTAYVPDGAYHLGAIVDGYGWVPELIETNNAEASAVIGIGSSPDLIVSSVSGPPSVLPGAGFNAAVTVCNQGTTPSHVSVVHLYLSADAAITVEDTPAGGAVVPYLGPGQCASVPVVATLYLPDGTYRLGAIVDAYDEWEELFESNNAMAGPLLGVGARPDLVVSAVAGPPSAPPGSAFDAEVTVCNQGTTPSYGADVALLLSSDEAITPSDIHAGSGDVPGLSPGQCASVAVPVSAYVPDGAHRLGAIVDPGDSVAELLETNNASAGSVIGVGFGPDLIVSAVNGPPSSAFGYNIDASVTVCNQGTQPSYGGDIALYLSSDATVTTADFAAGNGPVPYLAPGQCATVTVTSPTNAYVSEGAYHLGAIVDPYGWIPELIESNNAAAGSLLGVGHRPDLIVSAVDSPPSALPGSSFDAQVTVCNQGTLPSYGGDVELRLASSDQAASTGLLAGGAPVPYLDPGQCTVVTVPTHFAVPDGVYHFGAVVDPHGWTPELIETNNATSSSMFGVGNLPDLLMSVVSGPSTAMPGSSFDAVVTVCNQGTAPSGGGKVDVLLSSDRSVTPSDIHVGIGDVPGLSPGQCEHLTVTASAYAPDGAYHLGALVDLNGSVQELIETNNAAAGDPIAIGHGPDLVISAVSGPPSATPGGRFDASITVCNQGTAPSHASVEVVLSPDATLTTDDFIAGGAWLPNLDAGQCESLAVPADAYVPVGTYTLGAIVDAYGGVPELLESNNATAGGELVVTF